MNTSKLIKVEYNQSGYHLEISDETIRIYDAYGHATVPRKVFKALVDLSEMSLAGSLLKANTELLEQMGK